MKCHAALAAAVVVLAVDDALPDENVPPRTVELRLAEARDATGVTWNGEATSSTVPLIRTSYEKPTWTGWSIYSMLTSLFQDHGLRTVSAESAATRQGPFSPSAAVIEGVPGPPCSQRARGALAGSCRDSKNQKKVWAS